MIKKNDFSENSGSRFNQDIFSKVMRAGKRTYFFDVKSTRQDELYLTITESKRRFEQDGIPVFDKHKIFLYREDFEKFIESLREIVDYIDQNQAVPVNDPKKGSDTDSMDLSFDDLTI